MGGPPKGWVGCNSVVFPCIKGLMVSEFWDLGIDRFRDSGFRDFGSKDLKECVVSG